MVDFILADEGLEEVLTLEIKNKD